MRNLSQRALFLFAFALPNNLHTPMNTRTHARTHTHTHSRTIRVTQTCTGHVACLPVYQCVSVCVWVPKVTERVQSAPCFNGCWSLTETPLTWPARSSISNGQDLLQLNALGHQLPSCRAAESMSQRGNEMRRLRSWRCQRRDARCCRLCLFAVTASLRQLVAHSSFQQRERVAA